MAKCTLNPLTGQICAISGKVGDIMYKTYRNGQIRAYFIRPNQYRRGTPVSEKELRYRQLFAGISSEVARRIKEGDTRPKKIIWAEVSARANRERTESNA